MSRHNATFLFGHLYRRKKKWRIIFLFSLSPVIDLQLFFNPVFWNPVPKIQSAVVTTDFCGYDEMEFKIGRQDKV